MAGQVVRALVVPQFEGEHAPLPQPAKILPGRARVAAESGQGVPAQRNGRGVVIGERDEGIQQQVAGRELVVRPARRGAGGPGHLGGADALVEPGRELGSGECVQVGLARELEIQWLEPLGRSQQQQRRFVASAGGEGHLSTHQIDLGALQLVDRAVLGDGEQGPGALEGAGLDVGEGGGQRAPGPRLGKRGQFGSAGQEGGGSREPGPSLGPAGRLLQFGRHLLIGPGGGAGTVPGPPIRVGQGVGGFGEGTMHTAAVGGVGRPVGGRPDQRVGELHANAAPE